MNEERNPTLETEDQQREKYLTFTIDNDIYGIEICHVLEIVGIQTITEVPDFPQFIKGIINLRGDIIPVMDVRLRFKKPFHDYNDRTCIIVVSIDGAAMGLIVDKVLEVLTIKDSQIDPPPNYSLSTNDFIQGIGKIDDKVKLLIDCRKLLSEDEATQIKQKD